MIQPRGALRVTLLTAVLMAGACSSSDDDASPTVASTLAEQHATRTLSLVGLGDSVMGEGARDHTSFVDLYAQQIEASGQAASVNVTNLGDGGKTSSSLLIELSQEPLRTQVAHADIIVVAVGGDDSDPFASYPAGTCAPEMALDACLVAYAPGLKANYEAMLAEIAELRAGKPTVVRIATDYNPFVGWSEAPSPSFGADFYAQAAAAQLAAACEAASRHDAGCVDVLHLFNGPDGTEDAARFLAADHAHPGTAGLQAIAAALTDLGVAELDG